MFTFILAQLNTLGYRASVNIFELFIKINKIELLRTLKRRILTGCLKLI